MVGNFFSMVGRRSNRISLGGAASIVCRPPPLLSCLDIAFLLLAVYTSSILYYDKHMIGRHYL
ncbi:hypothetical protein Hanom_Chr14g01319351 [Helianthus anomalus]